MQSRTRDYERIEEAIHFIEGHFRDQPDLTEMAARAGVSGYHFQRLFKRWAGISPKRFVQFLTVEHAKTLLEQSRSLLDVTYEAGLSSPSRLHDLFVNIEAVTPGEFKNRGAGRTISYGIHETPFGECLLSLTEKGICGLCFVWPDGPQAAVADMKEKWSGARLVENPRLIAPVVDRIFARRRRNGAPGLTLFLNGTNFQIKVWEALLRIPEGHVVSYRDVALLVGRPEATRAVASAVAANPIGFLIPCHRVIRSSGVIGDYRWGSARKKALLVREAAGILHA